MTGEEEEYVERKDEWKKGKTKELKEEKIGGAEVKGLEGRIG